MTVKSQQALAAPINGLRGLAPTAGQPLRTHQRRRGTIAAGVLLTVIAALLVGVLYSRAGGKIAVIVTARPVPVGHMISRADLTTAQIAADTIPAYADGHMAEVVGKTAAVGLVAGEIVAPAMLSANPTLPAGAAVVGVAVKPGQLPADGLASGDTVMVIVLPATSPSEPSAGSAAGAAGARVLDESAVVLDSTDLASSDGSVVSLQVPDSDAAPLAAASNAGLVALVQVPSS